jgi:hypothetical protein
VLEAIRRGRTVARGPRGELHGTAADIAAVEEYLAGRGVPTVPLAERLVALAALAALAGLVAPGLAARGGR